MAITKLETKTLERCLAPVDVRMLDAVPHLIVEACPSSVECVLEAFKEPGGIFGKPMLFNYDGGPYAEPYDSIIIEDFSLWIKRENQVVVPGLAPIWQAGCFTMVVPATLHSSTLRMLYANADLEHEGCFTVERFLPLAIATRQDLGWCYIPLPEEEDGIALVVVADNRLGSLAALETRLLDRHLTVFRFS